MLESQTRMVSYVRPTARSSGFWPRSQNRLWVLTLSLSGAATHITAYTLAQAGSYTTRASRAGCAEERWKKFLSLPLPPDIQWELCPLYHRDSIGARWLDGRVPG